jgi:peroxiredoxin
MSISGLTRVVVYVMLPAALIVSLSGCGSTGTGATPGPNAPKADCEHSLCGQPAPDFAVASVNNPGKVALSSLKGKVVIVDFWATWCEPCKKSFPKLQELNVKYKTTGLEIVGISEDDEVAGVANFGKNYGAKFPLAWDKDKNVASKWDPKTMPTSFVIDKKGIVRFVHLGYHDGDEAKVEQQVKSLL